MNPGVPEVLFFHTVAIQQYGGGEGIRDKGALEAAIARPWMSFAGREVFPTPFDKAAAICESIINRNPFMDGNKRTGLSAGAYLLFTFGFELDAAPSELEAVAMNIEAGRMSHKDASGWFEDHARKV